MQLTFSNEVTSFHCMNRKQFSLISCASSSWHMNSWRNWMPDMLSCVQNSVHVLSEFRAVCKLSSVFALYCLSCQPTEEVTARLSEKNLEVILRQTGSCNRGLCTWFSGDVHSSSDWTKHGGIPSVNCFHLFECKDLQCNFMHLSLKAWCFMRVEEQGFFLLYFHRFSWRKEQKNTSVKEKSISVREDEQNQGAGLFLLSEMYTIWL